MVNGETGLIHIHRLVQRVIRNKIQTETILLELIELLKPYMDMMDPHKNDDLVKSLLPHAESLWKYGMKYEKCVEKFSYFPYFVCCKLKCYGRYNAAFQLARDSQADIQDVFGEMSLNTIKMKDSEADALYHLDKYPESLIIVNEIYSQSKSLLGDDHPQTLRIFNLKALNLAEVGKYKEALEMHNERLAIELKKNGQEPRETLTTLHNKGTVLCKLERYDQALETLQNVYELNVKVCGEEDASTLVTRYWIAKVLFAMGQISEALVTWESVYEARKLVLGEEHPQTLQALKDIQDCKELLSKT